MMSELVKAVAAALPQSILLGIIVGALVYSLRGPKGFTALAQFFLGLVLGIIVGCLFNLQEVLSVANSAQASMGMNGPGVLDWGLAPQQMRVLVQRLLIWGGVGGVLGLLRAQPGELANGAYMGGLMGLVAGVIVGVGLYLLDFEMDGLYRVGVTTLIISILLVFASIQADRRRTFTR